MSVSRSTKRPVDKDVVNVKKDAVAGSQVATGLITAAYPCTATGIRWDLCAAQDAGSGTCSGTWAIIHLPDSNTASTISLTDTSTVYSPEQHVLAFGRWCIVAGSNTVHWNGSTKTMRKLKVGDKVNFIALGVATNTTALRGAIQIFCKS